MPYALETPKYHHDVFCRRSFLPNLSMIESLEQQSSTRRDEAGSIHGFPIFADTVSLFQKLREDVPSPNTEWLVTLQSFVHSSNLPPPKCMHIIGLIPESHVLVSNLMGDMDVDGKNEGHPSLHRHNLAVKSPTKHVDDTKTFEAFVKLLRREKLAAVLAKDKYGRMGVLRVCHCKECKNPEKGLETIHLIGYVGDMLALETALFYDSLKRNVQGRANSRLYHMRTFNNWVKATIIDKLHPTTRGSEDMGLRVLDLVCI